MMYLTLTLDIARRSLTVLMCGSLTEEFKGAGRRDPEDFHSHVGLASPATDVRRGASLRGRTLLELIPRIGGYLGRPYATSCDVCAIVALALHRSSVESA